MVGEKLGGISQRSLNMIKPKVPRNDKRIHASGKKRGQGCSVRKKC